MFKQKIQTWCGSSFSLQIICFSFLSFFLSLFSMIANRISLNWWPKHFLFVNLHTGTYVLLCPQSRANQDITCCVTPHSSHSQERPAAQYESSISSKLLNQKPEKNVQQQTKRTSHAYQTAPIGAPYLQCNIYKWTE